MERSEIRGWWRTDDRPALRFAPCGLQADDAGGAPRDNRTHARARTSSAFEAGRRSHAAELARSGLLDLSVFEHQRFPLDDINRAISGLQNRNGGFSNYVIVL